MADGRATSNRVLDVIAEAIRSVDLDAMTADNLAAMLEQGDVADAEARAVLVSLNLAGFVVVHDPHRAAVFGV